MFITILSYKLTFLKKLSRIVGVITHNKKMSVDVVDIIDHVMNHHILCTYGHIVRGT
jgi:hypothetical protein